jgi:hypothetical protein
MSSVSRYASVGTATWTAPDGSQVAYLLRRFLPQPGMLATQRTHRVRQGDRVDFIAYVQLGDPQLSWLLADANPVSRPSQLNQPGLIINVPLPQGVPSAQ